MAQHIEIEFKNMLTKADYERLLQAFNVQQHDIQTQENHYFDTPDFLLKEIRSGLRIRKINEHYECTLKERTSEHGHLETTDTLSAAQAKILFKGDFTQAPHVYERLVDLQLSTHQLSCFGSLITDRVELDYQGGTLVLDHSKYLQEEDYEVEYETINEKVGQAIFEQFLNDYNLKKAPTDKKIARFMNALRQKGM